MNKQVIDGLKKKRADLAGQIKQLKADKKAIESALKVFGVNRPDLLPETFRERGTRLFEHGELMALVGKAQRDGLTSPTDITKQVMQAKGVDASDRHLFKRYYDSVKDCRKRLKGRVTVNEALTESSP